MKISLLLVIFGILVVSQVDALDIHGPWHPFVCNLGWFINWIGYPFYFLTPRPIVNHLNCPLAIRPFMKHCNGVAGLVVGSGTRTPKFGHDETVYQTFTKAGSSITFHCPFKHGEEHTQQTVTEVPLE